MKMSLSLSVYLRVRTSRSTSAGGSFRFCPFRNFACRFSTFPAAFRSRFETPFALLVQQPLPHFRPLINSFIINVAHLSPMKYAPAKYIYMNLNYE